MSDAPALAAILYSSEEDVVPVLAALAARLQERGHKVGGIVQRKVKGKEVMEAEDLITGQTIALCQSLGAGSVSCKLDAQSLAEAAMCIRRAMEAGVGLIIVDKFGKREAGGGGVRAEIAEAVAAGFAVIAAVPERFAPEWEAFTGGMGVALPCQVEAALGWYGELK